MGELRIERDFPVSAKKLFAFVTQNENLLKWWGPEGFGYGDQNLDLTKPGDWDMVMVDPSGGHHRISGVVLAIDPPRSVDFTLIVHAQEGPPSIDSTVRFEVASVDTGGSRLILTQTGLSEEDIIKGSTQGWISTLARLESLLNET
ncbi:MAG: SRPBCC domain-containing protein [Paracoccaceae bacterium]